MALLTRDQILSAQDIQREQVAVPEWGGDVLILGLTRTERDNFEDSLSERKGKKMIVKMANFSAKLLALCIVDEAGARLFSEADVEALGKKSAAAMHRCLKVATKLAGMDTEEVEELSKNCSTGPDAGSCSS